LRILKNNNLGPSNSSVGRREKGIGFRKKIPIIEMLLGQFLLIMIKMISFSKTHNFWKH